MYIRNLIQKEKRTSRHASFSCLSESNGDVGMKSLRYEYIHEQLASKAEGENVYTCTDDNMVLNNT